MRPGRWGLSGWRAGLVALAGLLLAGPLGALDLVVLKPTAGEPLFGTVEIEVEVLSEEPVVEVVIEVDGAMAHGGVAAGGTIVRLTEPPYRARVDVGQANRPHTLEIVARTVSGEVARRVIETPAIRVDEELELPLRQVYVTVERGGERVTDLPRSAFTVLDAGVRQELVTFEGGDVPMTVLFLIDASESMRGRRLDTALAGVESFLESLAPLDRASLVLFADRPLAATPFTGFAEVLRAALSGVTAEGSTAVHDHLYLGLLSLAREQGRRVVVLLSDGVDVASVTPSEQVVEAARRGEAMVYWVRPAGAGAVDHRSAWRDVEGYRQDRRNLEELVEGSGGRVLEVASVDDVPQAFAAILAEIRDQYVLGYYPSHDADDGSWHPLEVKVRGRGLGVRFRAGYFDE